MKSVKAFIYVIMADLRNNRFIKFIFAALMFLLSVLIKPFSRVKSTELLMFSHRVSDSGFFQSLTDGMIRNIPEGDLAQFLDVDKKNLDSEIAQNLKSNRIMILKPHLSPKEKGVILLAFTNTVKCFYAYYDLKRLLQDYYLIFEPSWSGYALPEILIYKHFNPAPIIIESPYDLDFRFIEKLGPNMVPVTVGANGWVDHRIFYPIADVEKKYDCVLVGGWWDYKRHYSLFRALSGIKGHKIKIAMIGSKWKSGFGKIKDLIDYFGLTDKIDICQDIPYPEMNIIYNQAKVNLLLSLKEGCNRALTEGFFANVPALMLKNNVGGAINNINEKTGVAVSENELPEMIVKFSNGWGQFGPREWAMNNISCVKSTDTLNKLIKQIAVQDGGEWTQDLRVKVNRPECDYFYEKDKISPDVLDQYKK